ncbi:hypothetical protein ABIA33_004894 [Streptacidiphilus sp. MAP12-16]|uniref:hypothetical protein n=1 Tax=Streptacidiphilus sp. MAP12-16 TaxID=3156300 RepID=UPI0035179BEE
MSADTTPLEAGRPAALSIARSRGAAGSGGPRAANRWIALAVLSIGTAVFSSLAASAITGHLHAHAATAAQAATITDATVAGYHQVFWIAALVFLGTAVLAAALFRSGPLPVGGTAPAAAL